LRRTHTLYPCTTGNPLPSLLLCCSAVHSEYPGGTGQDVMAVVAARCITCTLQSSSLCSGAGIQVKQALLLALKLYWCPVLSMYQQILAHLASCRKKPSAKSWPLKSRECAGGLSTDTPHRAWRGMVSWKRRCPG
jgi:hypothetical protein